MSCPLFIAILQSASVPLHDVTTVVFPTAVTQVTVNVSCRKKGEICVCQFVRATNKQRAQLIPLALYYYNYLHVLFVIIVSMDYIPLPDSPPSPVAIGDTRKFPSPAVGGPFLGFFT